MTQLVLLSPFQ